VLFHRIGNIRCQCTNDIELIHAKALNELEMELALHRLDARRIFRTGSLAIWASGI
jgi:hypothetical protein